MPGMDFQFAPNGQIMLAPPPAQNVNPYAGWWAELFRDPTPDGPPAVAAPAAPRPPLNFDVASVQRPAFPPGGGAQTFSFNPEAMPDAPTFGPDPALAERATYMAGRESRLGSIIDAAINRAESRDPTKGRWGGWAEHLARTLGAAAQADTLADTGGRVWNVVDQERQLQDDLAERIAQLQLGREDLGRDTAEAGFARDSGAYASDRDNQTRQFGVNTQNVATRNQAGMFNVQEANQNSRAGADERLRLALAKYQEETNRISQALTLAASLPGSGGMRALGGLLNGVDPQTVQGVMQGQARRALDATINRVASGGGTSESSQRRLVHAEMERLAGTTIARPPSNTPLASLGQYYSRFVPLDNPEVLTDFPGFGFATSPAE